MKDDKPAAAEAARDMMDALGQAEDDIREFIAKRIWELNEEYGVRVGALVADMLDRGDSYHLKFCMIPDFILEAEGIELEDGSCIPVAEWLESLRLDRGKLQ